MRSVARPWIHYAMIVRASSRVRLRIFRVHRAGGVQPRRLPRTAAGGTAEAGRQHADGRQPLDVATGTNVEIWLNRNHSVRRASIAAGERLQVPLDAFVAGFGQRFDYRRTQITDLRLKAKLPDGTPLELQKEFTVGGLEGAFGGKR